MQIGSVGVDEINQVGDWLAGLVRERNLPQKVLMLHQFRTSMIVERERLNTAHDELALIVHADGFGTQGMKSDTWNALRQSSPNVYWGWKNFIDEDRPMLEPEPRRCRSARTSSSSRTSEPTADGRRPHGQHVSTRASNVGPRVPATRAPLRSDSRASWC